MTVDALKQYPEELLANVRRVDLTAGLTVMIDRMLEADDDRRMVAVQRDQLNDRLTSQRAGLPNCGVRWVRSNSDATPALVGGAQRGGVNINTPYAQNRSDYHGIDVPTGRTRAT